MNKNILCQGAEALIKKEGSFVLKERIKKGYRLDILDKKIRKQRTKKEIKLLHKAFKIIHCPKVITNSDFNIKLEFIDGKKLSDHLDQLKNSNNVCIQIGKNLSILHNNSIIHGDLTTSNMILKNNQVYFIDFGLGFESKRSEDKAVDLYLIREALEAKHFNNHKIFFDKVLEGYRLESDNFNDVMTRLKKVELRGRYKTQC